MKLRLSLPVILRVSIALALMITAVPLASAGSSTEAKDKVGEMEKAVNEAENAARREKQAENDWFEKQSKAFQDWLDANKKEEEANAAREKADETGKEEDIKAAEQAEKIAKAAREKSDTSTQVSETAVEALEKAKEAKQKAKEKAAGTIAPAEEAVNKLPETSIKKKLKERIGKAKEELKQFALAPKVQGRMQTDFAQVDAKLNHGTTPIQNGYGELSRTKEVSAFETAAQSVMKSDAFQQYDHLAMGMGTPVVADSGAGASSQTVSQPSSVSSSGPISAETFKSIPQQTTIAKLKE